MRRNNTSILFLPGLLCTGVLFDYQISYLPDNFIGKNCGLPDESTMEALGRRLWQQNPGRNILCGLSLGGIICMEMFRQNSAQILGLILIDTNALDETELITQQRLGIIAEAEKSSPGLVAANKLFEKQVHPSLWNRKDLRKSVFDMADSYGLKKLQLHANALAGRPDYSPILREVRCPVLIISGEADRICPEEKQAHLHNLMPKAERISIPGAGHLSSIEQPEAVSEAMNQWLIAQKWAA